MNTGSLFHSEVDELLHKAAGELRRQLESGHDCRAENVLDAFPSLASDPIRALELIVLEFQLRQQLGQNPQPSDWYLRFPHWREQLRVRLEEAPPASLSRSDRVTAAVQTPSKSDASQQTLQDVDVETTPVLGRHEILEEIGRGGMGVVYRAHDLVLDRIVALKAILSGSLASADEARRFYREARAAAQLRHPNIVPIYGMGLYERQHCFTMALFPRGSLDQHMADYRQDIRSAVGLVVKVARAVQAAHERGIIHRDLKPGNILLDEQGEPAVSDFGLAKRLDVTATLSLPAQVIGTPAYMSPEQARCETATAASDIWSLGVILYELLTGHRPFISDGVESVMQKIAHTEVISPRLLRPDLPRDLETIVLRCLEKEPARRYPWSSVLADDLERWLRGEPIVARPEPRWQRLRRQFRRRVGTKGVLLLLLVGLLMLGTGSAGVWTLFIYLSPAAREQRRQDQILSSIQRDLAQGNSVTLVDKLGPPRWYRWRAPKEWAPLPTLKRSPLRLETFNGRLMLELLPDPQQVSYRYSAEVQIDDVFATMQIGLYFVCEELATPRGKEQCTIVFNLKAQAGKRDWLELRLVGICKQTEDEGQIVYEIRPPSKAPGDPSLPVPAPSPVSPNERQWRRLEVVVTPVYVQAFCDGVPMSEFAVADVHNSIVRLWRGGHPADFPIPNFPLRGGLGLSIANGTANVRSVVVEPLPQP